MKIYAILDEKNVVVNTIVVDGEVPSFLNFQSLQEDVNHVASVGSTWNGTEFVEPDVQS